MNYTETDSFKRVTAIIEELCNYERPICYKLSEVKVVGPLENGHYLVYWQKDPQGTSPYDLGR